MCFGRISNNACIFQKREIMMRIQQMFNHVNNTKNYTNNALLLFLFLFTQGAVAQDSKVMDYTGEWITCLPWDGRPLPLATMSIERVGQGYEWLQEWGSNDTVNGTASLDKGNLVLRGCQASRGVTREGCDEANPPVFKVLKKSFFSKQNKNIRTSLRRSEWVKTDLSFDEIHNIGKFLGEEYAKKEALRQSK
jgi:hypothetical protein